MLTINSKISLKELLESFPELATVFDRYGFSQFSDPEFTAKLSSFLLLSTFLRVNNIDEEPFIAECATLHSTNTLNGQNTRAVILSQSTMLALLPCGLKHPLDMAITSFASKQTDFNYVVEGNLNHEFTYYPYINSIENIDELPDVVISADLNSFFNHRFITRFINDSTFVSVNTQCNTAFEYLQYFDPMKHFTMFSANPLVLVHAKHSSRSVERPHSWEMLTDKQYHKAVAMRGDNDFFCSGVLVPLYKMYGSDHIQKMASSVCIGLHPAQMVKMIDAASGDIPPLYIMPLFFAKKIRSVDRVEIIYPDEGALLSPVQILVKKTAQERVRAVTDFLLGKELQQHCSNNYFTSFHPDVPLCIPEGNKLYWIGWDFIYEHDLEKIKDELRSKFTAQFLKTGKISCDI